MRYILLLPLFVLINTFVLAQNLELSSPDHLNIVKISIGQDIHYTIINNGIQLIEPSAINLELADHIVLGRNPVVLHSERKLVNHIIQPEIKVKSAIIVENFNELKINFKNHYSLVFRAYNNGVAYRFETEFKDSLTITNEKVEIRISTDSYAYFPKEKSFLSMNEVPYQYKKVVDLNKEELCSLPLLFRHKSGKFILYTESDINDYPGLWFKTDSLKNFEGTFPAYPAKLKNEGNCWDGLIVEKRANYIAKTAGKRTFPWRATLIAEKEGDLITNQLVYLLAKPAETGDHSWIKPGIATLDWWGRRNLINVDFTGGVNMETFKYFIDFNSKFGIPYFVLDDGWSDGCDIYKINKDLNIKEIFEYAKKKNVGIILWLNAHVIKKDVEGILDFFVSLGAKGIKVDFFNRDDQEMINLIHKIAKEAMDRKLIVDLHGVCKPFGLIRTYPNVLSSEGMIEFEQNGVSDRVNPILDNTLPFIRMVAGPMDYLPGTVTNAQKKEFKQDIDNPVGLGTRVHSMALSVVFECPITMLPDSPSDYLREKECTDFLSHIPVVWDETKVIDAKIGDYVIIARRSSTDWYLAAITNWDSRDLEVKLDFLEDKIYACDLFKDGPNSKTRAIDYKREEFQVKKDNVIKINLAEGGGWVAKFRREKTGLIR